MQFRKKIVSAGTILEKKKKEKAKKAKSLIFYCAPEGMRLWFSLLIIFQFGILSFFLRILAQTKPPQLIILECRMTNSLTKPYQGPIESYLQFTK